MRRTLLVVCGLIALTACQQQTNRPASADHTTTTASRSGPTAVAPPATNAQPAGAADSAAAPSTATAEGGTPTPPGAPQRADEAPRPPNAPLLAFDFRYQLALPNTQVRPMMDAHQEACERAGATQCQVVSVSSHDDPDGKTSGTLTLRATPAWMRAFRPRVEADVHDAHGRIIAASTEGEDVAPVIHDAATADNQLSAQADELRARLARNPDDEEARGELANVEAQIEQARTTRSDAQQRFQMATLVLDYQADSMVAPTGDAAPLAEATRHFWANTAAVAAVLVNIASILLPIALVVAPIWWFVARANRRRREAAPPASRPSPPASSDPPGPVD